MRLVLTNGYPFPFPADATEAEQHALSEAAPGVTFELPHVAHFEWKYTVTVELADAAAFQDAQHRTGWGEWGQGVLEARTSVEDGYEHPAIIVGDTAYCGFQLLAD